MPNPNRKDCLYYVLGKCARNDEGIPIGVCKRMCEFFYNWHTRSSEYPDNTYRGLGFNGMSEKDYE